MEFISQIEANLYEVSRVFLVPVLLLIAIALIYALWMLGGFLFEWLQRQSSNYISPLNYYATKYGIKSSDDIELWIMKKLEGLKIIARTAPMLGLIATMIPMGPALLALGSNDASAVGQNMVTAFSAVILALIAASICFFILNIRRRWLLEDLRQFEQRHGDK